ncbi:carboxylesterase family protein [Hypoxylon sp. NC0597]|nr:carboxylesterase family protein [Hypoxylon sp. NC0597]
MLQFTQRTHKEIYHFKNVRFGGKPERFSAPSFPSSSDPTLQYVTQGISCIQIQTWKLKTPPGGKPPRKKTESPNEMQLEDCLFLDIYAPKGAFEPDAKPLPVVVWFYGGAFAFGSKNPTPLTGPLYSGRSILRASNYKVIFIVGNYRLGAFGWLAGDYMQRVGQPNAGLYDQALLLKWVQEYVGKVGGDKDHVSAWGESAGAGSILHHLIREDGARDPLFKTFVVQSPAFEWAWDNCENGTLDNTYRNFSQLAGCGFGYNISCLRAANPVDLTRANNELFAIVRQTGLFPVGPAVDGKWIRSIPTVTFWQGRFWKDIRSGLISHCANEPHSFTPASVTDQTSFDEFLAIILPGPGLGPQREAIKRRYICGSDFKACIATIIRDASFTCNTRDLFNSYPKKSYMMEYAFPFDSYAYHATDLIPLFTNNFRETRDLLYNQDVGYGWAVIYALALGYEVRSSYQNYFASFALAGDPETLEPVPPVAWPVANGHQDQLSGVMKVFFNWKFWRRAFGVIEDNQNTRTACSFWTCIANEIMLARNVTFGEGTLWRNGSRC